MQRRPNTSCSVCKAPVYRRPNELKRLSNVYCSRKCQGAPHKSNTKDVICPTCDSAFTVPSYKIRKYCSRVCSNTGRRGITYNKDGISNKNASRLLRLLESADTTECMVVGCTYSKCLDVHRLVAGRIGGEYVEGNMFALCPNHHAEIHRGVSKMLITGDYELTASPLVETQLTKYQGL